MRTRLHDLVVESAGRNGGATAVTFGERSLSYAELRQEILAVGTGLRREGLQRTDRVAIYLDKRPETVAAVFGTSAAAGVFVPVNPLLRGKQVAYITTDCAARVLITSASRFDVVREELETCKSLELVVLIDAPTGGPQWDGTRFRVLGWAELTAGEPTGAGVDGGADVDMAAIFYTSGSTGRPKGVVLSHRNLLSGAESVSAYLENTADDVILSVLPLSFDAGFSQLTTAFAVGAQVVLMNYLLPADVMALCAKHRVTGLTCVPPLWLQLADLAWSAEAAANLRYFANTGGRMPRSTLTRLRAHFPTAKPYLMYGLTEAFRSTYLDPAEVDRRPDSIGKAIPNQEILVVRPDGTICDPGEEGELVHRGSLVALGYWNDAERTAERFRALPGSNPALCLTEMAVFSGDAVVRDEDGFLYFRGRTDEMIKTSGYRVSPAEIEEVVYETGLARDAVAFGVEDARLGQYIALVVSPVEGRDLDPDVLLAELRRALPTYMLPKQVQVRPTLPRSPNGKFDRALLRQEFGQQ